MTDGLHLIRVAVLQAQSNCPACGAAISVHGRQSDHVAALFRCGAIFDVKEGSPLTVLKSCPAPSEVAVAALNREIDQIVEKSA